MTNGRNDIDHIVRLGTNVARSLLAEYLPGQHTPLSSQAEILSLVVVIMCSCYASGQVGTGKSMKMVSCDNCHSLATWTPRDLSTEFQTNKLGPISYGQHETSRASHLLHHSSEEVS